MAKKIKKGTKGEKTQYLTRSKAIRKLQVSLKDFRRLCILKGIYPREPKKKFEGTNKTYYHIKDIKILLHDNLLSKFREIKAHLKKHKKLQGRKEKKLAEEHLKKTPKYSLSHIIKERYPTFLDALKDLDDALCLISLYASLPQHQTLEISKEDVQTCQKLSKEFMLYCTLSQCFKKAFFSIKGIYYQVEIMGQNITWIAPYQFNQRLPFDIDYKVMNTFLEFYQALLRFINFKLFTDIGLSYPLQQDFYQNSSHLNVNLVKQIQDQTRKKFEQNQQSKDHYEISEEFRETEEVKVLSKKFENMKKQRELFSKCTFFLNRETPIYCLQYLILSFGGYFVDDDSQEEAVKQAKVTHHVIDRPVLGKQQQNRDYVQPQWVVDSVNNLYLLPTAQYKPGVPPPPHLSPFVDNVQEGYIPNRQKEILQLKGEEVEDLEEESEPEQEVKPQQKAKEQVQQSGYSKQKGQKQQDPPQEEKKKNQKVKGDADSSSGEESESEGENEAQKKAKNQKLKKELKKEQEELGKILMSKRQRRMYEEIEKGQKQKKQQVQKLKEKKKKLVSQKH